MINDLSQAFTYFFGKDIDTGNRQREDLHVKPGLVHILQTHVNVVHGWRNRNHPVSVLNKDLSSPFIGFYTESNGCAVSFKLFQKLGGIEMIMDIDFHVKLLMSFSKFYRFTVIPAKAGIH